MSTLRENFAAWTFSRRFRTRTTVSTLAKRAGVSVTTILNIESGKANPTLSTMEAVACALNMPLSDMLKPEQPAEKTPEPRHSFLEKFLEILR